MKFEAYGTVMGYDFEKERWEYDCKYFLKDGWWYFKHNPEQKAMPLDKYQLKTIQKVQQQNPNKNYKMDDCIVA